MSSAKLPADESTRLQALHALQLLDTDPDPVLDGLVAVAARALRCPISLVSLVDASRQWFKAAAGTALRQTPREDSVCAHAIRGQGLFEIPDLRADPRFAGNPLVAAEPGIRFYAGMPVGVAGQRLGTLCVIDHQPRRLSDDERDTLVRLGRAVDHWLEAHVQRLALADRERSFRELAEQMPAIVYRTELGGSAPVHYVNPRIADLGYRPQDWIASREAWHDAVHPDDRARLHDELVTAIATGGTLTLRYRLRAAQGGWHQIQDTARVLPAQAGGHPVLQGVMVDVTETVRQQDWLRKLSAAVDQSAESLVITDLRGSIEYVNDATLQRTGYARDELLGRNPRLLKSDSTPASVYAGLWAELTAGRTWKGVLHNRRKDGSALLEAATISPVRDAGGTVTHYLAVKQDITENSGLRAELDEYRSHLDALVAQRTAAVERARADAEAANAAKSAFLAAMSHEIRTPMNGVIGVIELLERSSLTPDQKELTDTARDAATTLLALIDDVLDFSKIEAGRMALEAAPLDPAQLVESACDALQALAASRGVELHVFADPALPAQLLGDAVRLRQIITNLAGNAIKFSAGLAHAGRVSVRLGWQHDRGLELVVVDNGIGIAAEVQARLFQPFEQGERSTHRHHGGTGLGLTICRRLVDAMGGHIALVSAPRQGSRFEVRLPLPPAADAAPTRPAHDLGGLRCRLLVADDQRARDWAAYLGAAGAQVQLDHEPPRASDAATVWIAQAELLGAQMPPGAGVILRRGERHTPREEVPQRVSLDVPGVRRDALLAAVAIAAGRATFAEPAAEPTPGHTGLHGVTVLVAEDNDTNRKVLQRQLRLLGVAGEVANDGRAALQMWREGQRRYALLLTDLAMPELDGYALTAAIRAEEDPARRLPIVALTANALRGEAERCKDAGMDDYLSKPVRIDQLRRTLLHWAVPAGADRSDGGAAAVPAPAAQTGDARRAASPFDAGALRRLVGNDPALIATLRRSYLEHSQSELEGIQAAIASGDRAAASGLAHRWKSSSRAIGAIALGQALEEIELAGAPGRAHDARELGDTLASRFAEVRRWLTDSAALEGPADVRRVLLVDDDALELEHIERLLRAMRPVEVEAFAGAAALTARLAGVECSACLAMIDLNMPGIDGIELIRHLAESGFRGALALASGADRRVLETAGRLAQARGLRVLGLVEKPVSVRALHEVMARWDEAGAEPAATRLPSATPQEIRRAIDGGELRLTYQPQVDMHSGELAGVEALVRWQRLASELLPPSCFVPVAEQHGLAESLTRRVLDLALEQASAWRNEHGLAVRVAINVSMDNLVQLDFPEHVVSRLAHYGIAPKGLVLEVAETRLMKDLRAPLDILTRLRLRGIGLSIDDFGTGHSSLAQLRDLPFDELKVDRGFVHGGRDDPTRRAILTGSVEMAQQLGMSIVAEGVEDIADWTLVRQSGCTEAQGFLVAKPMPGELLPGWLAAWPKRRDELLAAAVA